jgi:hypothetical protein
MLLLLLLGLQLPGRVLSEPVLFRHVHPLAGGQQDLETEGRGEEAEARDVVQQSVAKDVVLQSVAVPQTAVAAEAVGVPGGWHGRYHRFHCLESAPVCENSFLRYLREILSNFRENYVSFKPVLGIRNRIRVRKFLGLPDPDPLVRGKDQDQDPDPSLFS